ncbi:hypothetical protein CC85DRAFT_93149 [Cutaneotrichosporon oleaginosum]|uniref:Uncharacterized protein n=1 Tax=Cutaneotrichosporon oleaginosum TaxID=879819 RepID=A0A0J0XMN0_9TREE|nr:uncharacterized protein CC85DRAFT_93149 [Cutaneotrichosporon oleaginosum]KLT42371.1 hypothetical protein CC85DRAFT_93149 [Cutaneotrichosporon oleaginosum]TXT04191.1 hypothetical protein COLE_07888 [Cutaneotrichosporon oleaginosum]
MEPHAWRHARTHARTHAACLQHSIKAGTGTRPEAHLTATRAAGNSGFIVLPCFPLSPGVVSSQRQPPRTTHIAHHMCPCNSRLSSLLCRSLLHSSRYTPRLARVNLITSLLFSETPTHLRTPQFHFVGLVSTLPQDSSHRSDLPAIPGPVLSIFPYSPLLDPLVAARVRRHKITTSRVSLHASGSQAIQPSLLCTTRTSILHAPPPLSPRPPPPPLCCCTAQLAPNPPLDSSPSRLAARSRGPTPRPSCAPTQPVNIWRTRRRRPILTTSKGSVDLFSSFYP